MMVIFVKGDDIKTETKGNICHWQLQAAQESMGLQGSTVLIFDLLSLI